MTLLSFVAIVLLPRQFHVTVVENNSEAEIKRAAWLFPLYLVLINLFVMPIALAGLLIFPRGRSTATCSCWRCRSRAGSNLIALAAFVGGLSAATAMVIVETVALAIMVSNDIVVPLVLSGARRSLSGSGERRRAAAHGAPRRDLRDPAARLSCIIASPATTQLASIGLLSFAAVAQLAPAFFGGLIWRRGTARGAIAGMSVGFLVWAYTLLLPSFADAGARRATDIVAPGPFGIGLLRPQALLGPRPAAARPRRAVEPRAQHHRLCGVLAAAARRARSSGCRPICSCRPILTPIAPSFRLWRSSVTVEELTGDGRALSRRRAHALLVRELRGGAADQPRPDAARRISSCCATPSTCSPRRSAPPRRGSCSRCCCASARCRPRPRSSCSTMPTRRSSTTARSCRPRSTTCARASRCSTRSCSSSAGTGSSAKSSTCRPSSTRVGIGSTRSCASTPSTARSDRARVEELVHERIARYATRAPSRSSSASPNAASSSRCAPTTCPTAASSRPSPTSRRASRRPKRSNAPTRRWNGASGSAPRS